MPTFRAVVACVGLLLATPSIAAAPDVPEHDLHAIASSTEWRALLHFDNQKQGVRGRSQVDDAGFFLSSDGDRNTEAELRSTLQAFYLPVEGDINRHAICRFPARWEFLRQRLALGTPPVTPGECPEFSRWFRQIAPHSVTLVFASSYLNSPSSMYGHTFLRVDPAGVAEGSTWLSWAINFGAQIKPDDNSLLYAYKGVFGGYPGYFSVVPYYKKIKEYSRIENRDLWEYQLNLSVAETRFLVTHLWELRDVNFDYFFFDENCSYRLLELLEVARPSAELTEPFSLRAIPIDTVRAVVYAGFVTGVYYRPSVMKKLQIQIDKLTPQQQELAHGLASAAVGFDDPAFERLAPGTRFGVLQVAYGYLRYQQLGEERTADSAGRSLELLRRINELEAAPETPVPEPTDPVDGHDTLLFGLAGGDFDGDGGAELRLRLSYHDLADPISGYPSGSSLNMGELLLRRAAGHSTQLELFNLVQIQSDSPRTLFFKPVTWQVEAGVERVYSSDKDTLAPRVQGGAGVTYPFLGRHLAYALGVGRADYNSLSDDNWRAGAGPTTGVLLYFPWATIQLENTYIRFVDGDYLNRARGVISVPLDRDDALRLTAAQVKDLGNARNEFKLEWRHYF